MGDRILKVNGTDVTAATHQEAVMELLRPSDEIKLTIQHDPLPVGFQVSENLMVNMKNKREKKNKNVSAVFIPFLNFKFRWLYYFNSFVLNEFCECFSPLSLCLSPSIVVFFVYVTFLYLPFLFFSNFIYIIFNYHCLLGMKSMQKYQL